MKYMQLERRNQVYVLTLTNGANANALNPDVLAEYFAVFDEIEANPEDASLLIQSDDDKTFCNGLDLAWLIQQSPQTIQQFIKTVEDFFVRMSVLNLPVIAAINGNCYAGGAVIATACDFRVMRSDRGRFCFSEINIKMPFTPPMVSVIQALPNAHALWELALTGVAFGGEDCLKYQVVDQIVLVNKNRTLC
jgi:enoyl-CoA hydratase/carnithine racemase